MDYNVDDLFPLLRLDDLFLLYSIITDLTQEAKILVILAKLVNTYNNNKTIFNIAINGLYENFHCLVLCDNLYIQLKALSIIELITSQNPSDYSKRWIKFLLPPVKHLITQTKFLEIKDKCENIIENSKFLYGDIESEN